MGSPMPFQPTSTAALPDGRTLAWDDYGSASDPAVLLLHGAPAGRWRWREWPAVADRLGIRLIMPERPGCGVSTFQPGRRVIDWAADVSALADHLGLAQYCVVSISGGSPFALACAAAGDPRLARTAVVAGPGPLNGPGAIAGVGAGVRPLFEIAMKSESDALVPLIEPTVGPLSPDDVEGMMTMLSDLDRAELAPYPGMFEDVMDRSAAIVDGVRGIAHDIWLLSQPWGFDLASVPGPVDFYSGDRDETIPVQHSVDMAAAVPNSSLTVWPRAGHVVCNTRCAQVMEATVALAKGE